MSLGNYKNLEIKQARKSLQDDSSFPTNYVLTRTLDYTDSSEIKKFQCVDGSFIPWSETCFQPMVVRIKLTSHQFAVSKISSIFALFPYCHICIIFASQYSFLGVLNVPRCPEYLPSENLFICMLSYQIFSLFHGKRQLTFC